MGDELSNELMDAAKCDGMFPVQDCLLSSNICFLFHTTVSSYSRSVWHEHWNIQHCDCG